ncbi:MAG: O-antigen ligase family protein [Desulforhopalus sp.]|nr:O-antigen ligase family protein [Desulforhopalus sp.]
MIAAFFYEQPNGEKIKLFASPIAKSFGLYCLMAFIDWLGKGGGVVGPAHQSFLSFFLFFYATMKLVNTREKIDQVIWALVVSMFLGSIYIIKEYLTYREVMGAGFRTFGATFGDPNYYALSAILVVPFIYYLFKLIGGKLLKAALVVMMIIFFIGLLVTQSRGALVGLLMMLFVGSIISNRKIKTLVVVSIIVCIGIFAMPDNLKKRITETKVSEEKAVSGDEASTTRRWHLFLAGIEMIKDKPLTGVGLGKFKDNSMDYYPKLGHPGIAHSTYIEIMAEMGVPSILFFLSVLVFTFRELFFLRKIYNLDERGFFLANTLIVTLTGFLFSCAFLSGEYTKIFWILIFLTIRMTESQQN